MKFLIQSITRRNGEIRTDGKYPERTGSIIEFIGDVNIGHPAFFKYIKLNDGSDGGLRCTQTSRVDDIEWYKDNFYIYTRNSIYKFVPYEGE